MKIAIFGNVHFDPSNFNDIFASPDSNALLFALLGMLLFGIAATMLTHRISNENSNP